MQPDSPERSLSTSSQPSLFGGPDTPTHHGTFHASSPFPQRASPPLLDGHAPGSSSEWSLSPSSASASGWGSPAVHDDAWLNTARAAEIDNIENLRLDEQKSHDSEQAFAMTELDSASRLTTIQQHKRQDDTSTLHDFPEEMLFQIMSHLPAADLLNVKLVSRRFHALVTSPLAWMNAFSRFFPGADSLKENNAAAEDTLRSEQRPFTRLSPSVSWSSEYLSRTRLLRCLERGRPSLPFAAPSPGKPGKGSAVFTFSSRILGCSALHADFGTTFDKRKPQFVHGLASSGSVTASDRRGKFDSWGFINRVAFRHFHETHPGYLPFGLDNGDALGVPNMMDVSQLHGMVYGEGTPGGSVYHLAATDKHGSYLSPFLNISFQEHGVPRVDQYRQSTCSTWIAKTAAVPQVTRGMVGMLSGSSAGIVSAYSLGSHGKYDQRFAKGQLTARWLLSPGVPIIRLIVDDAYNFERADQRRVWAVALNALGEVFYLKDVPASNPTRITHESLEEIEAWQTGRTCSWKLVQPSLRNQRLTGDASDESLPSYLPRGVLSDDASPDDMKTMSEWIAKTPADFRAQFSGWDMRRLLEVDFANDDSSEFGEAVFVFGCGEREDEQSYITRYMRASPDPLQAAFSTAGSMEDSVTTLKPSAEAKPTIEGWRVSNLVFGSHKNVVITAVAIDESRMAVTRASEDYTIRKLHPRAAGSAELEETNSESRVPGRRARYVAVGTLSGSILVWNARAPASQFSTLTNDIKPLRFIQTESPGVASLALTALCLVHGGEEGLVQAWDPLASTDYPLRTLSSRYNISGRRRAVVAAQQASAQQTQIPNAPWWFDPDALAASAIRLDPDPHVLRGVAAIGGFIKYWSYSSVPAAEDLSRSQKRRMKRPSAKNSPSLKVMDGTPMVKSRLRANPRGFIDQEILHSKLDQHEHVLEQRRERRMAGRFGLDLLGDDASEEEMLAYAKLLSEEESERERRREAAAAAATSRANAEALDAVDAQSLALSDADAEKWRYASWAQRYEMLPEGAGAVLASRAAGSTSATVAAAAVNQLSTPSPSLDDETDPDLRRALELSLRDSVTPSSATSSPPSAPVAASASRMPPAEDSGTYDPDLAEALALSLSVADASPSPSPSLHPAPSISSRASEPRATASGSDATADHSADSDLARAIALSLASDSSKSGAQTPTRARPWSSAATDGSAPSGDEDAFPALGSSPARRVGGSGVWGSVGKGKGRRER